MAIIQDIMNVVPSWQKHINESGYLKADPSGDYHQKAGYNFKENFPNTPAYLADALAKAYQYSTEGIGSFFNEGTFSDAMARAKEESRLNSLGFRGQGFDMDEYNQTMDFARTGDTSGLTYGSAQAKTPDNMTSFPTTQQEDENDPYDFTDRLRRRGDFTTKYPSYNAWQMRGAQAPGWKRNAGRMMDFLRGPGTRLTPAQQRANQSYMNQQRITRDPQTGRMVGGLFAGQNAPGTSFFGSKTFPEMAQKWALKNQHRTYKTPKMQQKQQGIISVATGGRDPSQGNTVTGHGTSGMGRDPSDKMARGGLASLWPR